MSDCEYEVLTTLALEVLEKAAKCIDCKIAILEECEAALEKCEAAIDAALATHPQESP